MDKSRQADNKLKRTDKIFLYGYNERAVDSYHSLVNEGYSVVAIIDKRAKQLNGDLQRRVIGLDEIELKLRKKEAVCVICLNNGLEHDNLARWLYSKGFDRILYLPVEMSYTKPLMVQHDYRTAYRNFLNRNYDIVNIPEYSVSDNQGDFLLINEDENTTVFWCPKNMLRAGTKKQYEKVIEDRCLVRASNLLKYVDCRIEDFTPYIALFDALGGNQEADVSEYLMLQRNTESEGHLLYEDRKKLFYIYEERFRYDMSFFMDSPIKVEWNDNGWLTICDGLHRLYYLNYKGYDCYPVETSNVDFKVFVDYYKKQCL